MNVMDYLQPLKETIVARWEEFQESTAYSQIKERYDSLSPVGQKSLMVFGVFIFLFLVYQIPNAFLSSASDSIDIFEERKAQVSDMLDVTQESKALPPLPQQMDAATLKNAISSKLQESSLLPEQIKDVSETTIDENSSSIIPTNVAQNIVNVRIEKINLKQAVDIEFQLSKISPLVKVMTTDIAAHPTDNHYYDVKYLIASFSAKESEKEVVEDKKGKPRPTPKGNKKATEDALDEDI